MFRPELMWRTRPNLCKLSFSPHKRQTDFQTEALYLNLSSETLILTHHLSLLRAFSAVSKPMKAIECFFFGHGFVNKIWEASVCNLGHFKIA